MKKKRIIRSIVIVLIFILLFAAALDTRLKTVTYELQSEKIQSPVRLAVVSDLHSCLYGDGQKNLADAIVRQNPDIVLYTGDIFDDNMPNENTIALLEALRGKYPAYYVTGNHEYWSYASEEMLRLLRQYGVKALQGEWDTVAVNGQKFAICGVDDPDVDRYTTPARPFREQLQAVGGAALPDDFTVLLSHRPELFAEYEKYAFDLVLSGHAHGGQWRIPGILNGLYAPEQGWVPKYAGGQYARGGITMIVSRGLAKESTRLPRIFNRPEVVIVELKGQ